LKSACSRAISRRTRKDPVASANIRLTCFRRGGLMHDAAPRVERPWTMLRQE
jgi:hypothetical protein